MTNKKKIILISGAVLLAGLIIGGVILGLYLKRVNDYRDKIGNTDIGNIDISSLPDGVYVGEYDVDFIYAKATVTVSAGRITDIVLVHRHDRGAKAEAVIDYVKDAQSLDVPVVTGATNSGKTILKAIENALRSGPITE